MSDNRIKNNLNTILNLEYLGVRFENTKEESDNFDLTTKTVYYYSVPESSVIELDNEELNNRIKTSDGLKLLAKELITEMIIDYCKNACPNDEELIEDIKSNTSKYLKCCAKIRKGEIWNEEMGNARVKKLWDEMMYNTLFKIFMSEDLSKMYETKFR